ncbi:hypothetical protein BX600DRAFT_517223 [Xylariales sp. PMI_506]|nr:hypothetical protein BX600DRAFT_517223 [Xylariales sp. PMI_506]
MRYAESYDVLPAIRHLNVHNLKPKANREGRNEKQRTARDQKAAMNRLLGLIPQMTGLEDITLANSELPEESLALIERRRKLWIHARYKFGGSFDQGAHEGVFLDMLARLGGGWSLRSLTLVGHYSESLTCLKYTQPLKKILLSCPNLRNLSLDIRIPDGTMFAFSTPREYAGCGLLEDERPAPLEDFELIDYPFGENPQTPSPRFSTWGQSGYPVVGSEQDHWAATWDWSQLRRLTSRYTNLALRLMPHLTSLCEVVFLPYYPVYLDKIFPKIISGDDIKTFIARVPAALESITVPTLSSISLNALLRHGSSLKKLQIHQYEEYNERWKESALDAEMLRHIRDGCPGLEELNIDLKRDGEWPYDALDIIASFPRLSHVKIWFQLGLEDDKDPVLPYVTASAAHRLFSYIRERGPKKPASVRCVDIYSGCPRPPVHGGVLDSELWSDINQETFHCKLPERDDERLKRRYTVQCSSLSEEENYYLNDLVNLGVSCPEYNTPFSQNFKIACDGPTPRN